MPTICPRCNEYNLDEAHCVKCGYIFDKIKEVQWLRDRLANLQSSVKDKVQFLEQRIDYLESQIRADAAKPQSIFEEKTEKITPIENKKPSFVPDTQNEFLKKNEELKRQEQEKIEEIKKLFEPQEKKTEKKKAPLEEYTHIIQEKQEKEKAKKEKSEQHFKKERHEEVINPTEVATSEMLSQLPFAQALGYFSQVYEHYKSQGKLPVFFMTVGGAVAMLFGFGYLMQFMPDFWFELIKVIGSFTFTISLMTWGSILIGKDVEKYGDFGSALIGLGTAINYLLLFWLSSSSVFTFFSWTGVGFSLIFLNTLVSSWLALKFETKVVAVVSLVGGAFAPFYLQLMSIAPLYLGYLWLLCAAAIFLALAIKWKVLVSLAFVIAASIWQFFSGQLTGMQGFWVLLSIHAFAYLFYYWIFFEKYTVRKKLGKQEIFLLIGNTILLCSILFVRFQNFESDTSPLLGGVYLANTIPFLMTFFLKKDLFDKKVHALFFLLAGTFAGLAMPALLDQRLVSVFWALEGLGLVFIGFLYDLSVVRKEGYVVLLIATGKNLLSLETIDLSLNGTLWSEGYFNLWASAFSLIGLYYLLKKFDSITLNYEKDLKTLSLQFFSICLSPILLLAGYFTIQEMVWNWAMLLMILFIVWGASNKMILTEVFGWVHFIFLSFGYIISVETVNSYIFRDQTTFGKIAMVEMFISLWLFQWLYEKVVPLFKEKFNLTVHKQTSFDYLKEELGDLPEVNEKLKKKKNSETYQPPFAQLAVFLRVVFFLLLPLILLPSVNRFYPEYLSMMLWGAVVINMVVYYFTRNKSSLVELHLLILLATIGILDRANYLPILLGMIVLWGWFVIQKGYDEEVVKDSPYRYIFAYCFYYVGFCLMVIESNYFRDMQKGAVLLLPAFYLVILVILKDKLYALKSNVQLAYRLGQFFWLGGSLFLLSQTLINIRADIESLLWLSATIIGLGFLIHSRKGMYPNENEHLFLWVFDLLFFHILLILGYSELSGYFFPDWAGVGLTVALTLHAVSILFLSSNERYSFLSKLSIALFVAILLKLFLKDMVQFNTIQKVILLMLMGALMLGGSFLYLKLRKKRHQ
ncbi:MAG: DUF2339 domain-containing protein [Flammeovirgaceae bacterium]